MKDENKVQEENLDRARYSDAELEEFKQIILEKLDKAMKDYDQLKKSIQYLDGNDIQDTSPTFKMFEEGASNLSKEDIERMKRDAESHADEDEKRRNSAEIKNEADSAIFNAEKLMRDLGEKMTPDEKGKVNSKIDALKKAMEKNDEAGMKSGKEDLMNTLQEFGSRLYQNAGAGQNPGANANSNSQSAGNSDNETGDAEFTDKN